MEIIATKLLQPRLKPGMIEHKILSNPMALLENKKAILVVAPPGYGKTTFMLQMLDKTRKPLVWYQLDAYDNDPAVFMRYLVAAFQQKIPRFIKEVPAIINQGDFHNNLRLLLGIFINGLAHLKSEIILVLDDFQVITEPVIHRFIQEFIERLPENSHLFMASRTSFPLSLSRLTATGEIVVIDSQELRFSRDEIKEYLSYNKPNPPEDLILYLEEKTNGWPIALALAAVFPLDNSAGFYSRDNKEIYSYLAGEVLEDQPQAIRDFLITTSVLEELTPEYCDLLLERSGSSQILDYLEKQQLFLTALEGKTSAYHYHHLFREFLQSRLGEERLELMRRAGIIARDHGEYYRAVESFIAAGFEREAVTTIEMAGKSLLTQGRWLTVSHWLESLSSNIIAGNPWLSLYQARVELYRNRIEEVEKWNEKALTLFHQNGDQTGLAEARLVQARILRHRGQYRESLEHLEAAESHLAMMGPRVDLPLEKSILFYLTGKLNEAESLLLNVLEEAERLGDGYIISHLLEGLGNIYYIQGDYQKALGIYKKGIQVSPERILPGYYALDFIAIIHQDWGELEPAYEYAKRNVTIKENLGMNEALPSAYLHLAFIYFDRGEIHLATDCYEQAFRLIRDNHGDSFYLALNLVFWARCLAKLNRWNEAQAKVEEAIRVAGPEPSLALANCLAVGGMVLFLIGDLKVAEEMLRQGTVMMEQIGFRKGLCYAYEMSAALYFSTKKLELAGEYARKALKLAARLNDLQVFITFYDILYPILKYGLENGIEVTFIIRILARLGPASRKLLSELAVHPDPEARKRIILPLAELGAGHEGGELRRLMRDEEIQVAELACSVACRIGLASGINQTGPELRSVRLLINGLGPLFISLQNNDITAVNWRSEKARDLLIYLTQIKEPVKKERILEDLWPKQEELKSDSLVHTTVYRLRQILNKYCPDNLIVFGGGRYQLLPDSYETDWNRFEQLLRLNQVNSGITEGKAPVIEEAVSLYRGHYLEDLDYHWLLPCQEHYKNLYIQGRLNLARFYIHTNEYQKAINHLVKLMETNNLLEEAQALMMTAYAGMGDRIGIARHYQNMVKAFRNELGLQPPVELVRLYNMLYGAG